MVFKIYIRDLQLAQQHQRILYGRFFTDLQFDLQELQIDFIQYWYQFSYFNDMMYK